MNIQNFELSADQGTNKRKLGSTVILMNFTDCSRFEDTLSRIFALRPTTRFTNCRKKGFERIDTVYTNSSFDYPQLIMNILFITK